MGGNAEAEVFRHFLPPYVGYYVAENGRTGWIKDASAFLVMITGFYLFFQPLSMPFQQKTSENPYFPLYHPAFKVWWGSYVAFIPLWGRFDTWNESQPRGVHLWSLKLHFICLYTYFRHIFNRKQRQKTFVYIG